MKSTTLLVTALACAGCYNPEPVAFHGLGDDSAPVARPPTTTPTTRTPYSATPAPVQPGASLTGDLGQVRGFSSDAVEVRVEGVSGNTVQLDAVNDAAHWWVMARFNFSQPLSSAQWAPGTLRTFSGNRPSTDGMSVSTIGCSGPTRGRYTYDSSPDTVTVHVQEGSTPDARLVTFAAYWNAGGHTVTGSFEYLPR